MLYALNPSMSQNVMVRVLGIVGFALITAIAAQLSIPLEPVPITMQPLAVLAAGLVLGGRDGAMSIALYLAGIAANLPIAANGMGAAAFAGPTAGYLYSFPIAAGVMGLLAVRGNVWVRLGAGLVAMSVIYLIGATYLKVYLDVSWATAWDLGVAPFIVLDMLKAIIVATAGEGARRWWMRQLSPLQ